MAILNLTPDSFYAPSRATFTQEAAVVERARAALEAGADLLDLGGESTRPGAAAVPPEDEQRRLLPALRRLRQEFPAARLSVDTRHAATAAAALEAGAAIVNDVSGLEDAAMGGVLAARSAGTVLMHLRGEFSTMHQLPRLEDPLGTVRAGLEAILARARMAGVAEEAVVLDPGFGFGKNLDENLPLLSRLDELHALDRPLLAGLSRKSFLRPPAGDSGPEDRLPASLAAAAAAVLAGVHILRVHDVAESLAAARFADRLLTPA